MFANNVVVFRHWWGATTPQLTVLAVLFEVCKPSPITLEYPRENIVGLFVFFVLRSSRFVRGLITFDYAPPFCRTEHSTYALMYVYV
jgi:hypothetical protein